MTLRPCLPLLALLALAAGGAAAQTPAPPRTAPPEPMPRSDGSGSDAPLPGSVIRPPMQVDPGIATTVPEPNPNTTPVIRPPTRPGEPPAVERR